MKAVQDLPSWADPSANDDANAKKYWDLIHNFGTHFLSHVVFGTEASVLSEFTSDKAQQLADSGVMMSQAAQDSFQAQASGLFGAMQAGASLGFSSSTSASHDTSSAHAFDSARTSVQTSYTGNSAIITPGGHVDMHQWSQGCKQPLGLEPRIACTQRALCQRCHNLLSETPC